MERKNIKNIIREIPAENAYFASYFDGDCFTERAGDYCCTMFIIRRDCYRTEGFNAEEYENVVSKIIGLLEGFDYVKDGAKDYGGRPITYKSVMQDYGIKYSPAACHKLKEFHANDPGNSPETVAEYLTITTGKKWDVTSARGYCQGDYCEIIYCSEIYTENGAVEAGEIYLGAATEYCVIDIDENGEETDTVYGYIVAESTAYRPEDVKKIVCDWACINPEETILQTISGYNTRTEYEYEEA